MPFDNPTPVIVDPIVALLQAGKRRVKRFWVKGQPRTSFRNSRGHYGYCLVGSVMYDDSGIEAVSDEMGIVFAAHAYLNMAAQVLTQSEYGGAVGLNDDRKSIKADALLCFDVAIELAERKEAIKK